MPTESTNAKLTPHFDRETLTAVLQTIDPAFASESLAGLLKAAGGNESAAIQALFGQLNKVVLGGSANVDEGDLQSLIDAINSSGTNGKVVSLAGADSAKLASMAGSDIGVRYALIHGLPFAVTGNPALYDNLNRDGSLFKFDPNTGEKLYTDEWLKDRAQFLSVKFNAGGDGAISVSGSQSWTFEERTDAGSSRLQINADQGVRAANKMIFATGTSQTQTIVGGSGGDKVYSGSGDDRISTTQGNNVLIGGTGNDTISTGGGNDLIAFNAGDGNDHVRLGGGKDSLSLGGGIRYEDLSLAKQGNDLKLNLGNGESIVFDDWYSDSSHRSLVNLQMIADSLGDHNQSGSNTLKDDKVELFDFQALVSKFEDARRSNPQLSKWNALNSMLATHLNGSDTAALGGDLAYQFGHNGSLSNVSVESAQALLAAADLNVNTQALQAVAALRTGGQRLM